MSDLMADLMAAASKDEPTFLYASTVKRLLALLDAGKACRDAAELGVEHICNEPECKVCPAVRQYDEAAK